MAFGMQDVLLEPYGGQVLGMSVGADHLADRHAGRGGLLGFSLASACWRGVMDPARLAPPAPAFGVPAFAAVITAAATGSHRSVFATGVLLIGFGGGLFGHGTLTVTMNRAPTDQAGLALGAWGAVQATAAAWPWRSVCCATSWAHWPRRDFSARRWRGRRPDMLLSTP
jgi:BCD family chlorophyll transporter-like MFS transporter